MAANYGEIPAEWPFSFMKFHTLACSHHMIWWVMNLYWSSSCGTQTMIVCLATLSPIELDVVDLQQWLISLAHNPAGI